MAFRAEQFRTNLVYEAAAPLSDLRDDIALLRAFDKSAETGQTLWLVLGVLGLIAAIAVTVLALSNPGPLPIGGVIIVIGGDIFAWIQFVGLQGRNVENRRYELLDSLIQLLGTDVAPDAVIEVRLDLKPPGDRSKFTNEGQIRDWNVKYFTDEWLRLGGRFLDGTKFVCTVTELLQKRSRWARSASGKTKHKSKSKSAMRVAVTLRPKAGKYPGLAALAGEAQGAIQLPPDVEPKGFACSARAVTIKAASKAPKGGRAPGVAADTNMVAMMFLSLYQVLNLARRAPGGEPT